MPIRIVGTRYTPEQYLALERLAEERSKYVEGDIFPMPGASRAHNLIGGNIFRVVSTQLEDRPCEVYINDMRVAVDQTRLFTYPDVVVVCGEPDFFDGEMDTLLNPTLLVKVLSPSPYGYEGGGTFGRECRLESLKEFLVVAQEEIRVECHSRRGERWIKTRFTGLEDVVRLESIDCQISMRQIYAKTKILAELERGNGG